MHEENGDPVQLLCQFQQVSRTAYYRWLAHPESAREAANRSIEQKIQTIHDQYPEMGYRRIRDELDRTYQLDLNDKHVLRICRHAHIQSTIKWRPKSSTKRARQPVYTAENVLNRNFHAEAPDQKWCTDISEFHYGVGSKKQKLYLSAILDLCDHRIVAYQLSDSNDLPLVLKTFEQARQTAPEAHPLVHEDRGYQYTSKAFHALLVSYGMTQSMSRVGKCIDNGPMEGFWGMIKRERYYGRTFTSRKEVMQMIEDYMEYYNHGRYQRRLGTLTPMEVHQQWEAAA